METKFTQEYQASLKVAWNRFIENKNYDYSFIRPEILTSWERSRKAEVDPFESNHAPLKGEELNIRINSHLALIEVVHPYLENLFSVVKGSGFYILLCDKDGYILDLLGDNDIIEHGKNKSLLVVGANRQESVVGTNAIGTCLAMKEPVQIWGGEHYLDRHKGYVCAGAPIFDPSGNILGCLAITGLYQSVHPHTLGMVTSAVDGIMKELSIKKAYEDIELISAQRNSIIQSMTSGLILLNRSGRVIQINDVALNMLQLKYDKVIGKSLFEFITFDERANTSADFSMIQKETYNKEVNVYHIGTAVPPMRFNMSVNFVRGSDGNSNGTVVRFNEPRVINALAGNVSGYKAKYTFDSIIGNSAATKAMIATSKKAAQSSSNVLILGESGTGKELLAQSMHNMSPFASGPFVAINCAALPKGLVESELFGYEKGAFTGANRDGNPGKFELADGGTIFLDEIGDMPLDVQASLLRVIQTKELIRVGGKYPKAITVRIIAATNQDLQKSITEKTFREDLYYRLNVLNIDVPRLSERGDDVLLLADYFAALYDASKSITIDPSVYSILRSYHWPGNIRQLENVIERAVNITESDQILPAHLPAELQNPEKPVYQPSSSEETPKGGKELILSSLQQCRGNVTEAAKLLGISRRTLYRKLDKFGIDSESFRIR